MTESFYKYHIFCCLNKRDDSNPKGCCMARGAEPVFRYLKQRVKELQIPQIRVNKSGCLDRCEYGPVIVIYPEAVWYSCSTKEDAETIIQQHLLQGKVVEKLAINYTA